MKACILVRSSKGNRYLVDRKRRKTFLCPPLFYWLLKRIDEGKDVKAWLDTLPGDTVAIEDIGTFSREEIDYYYRKYLLLKENGHFEPIDQEKRLSKRLTADDVKDSLANVTQVTFEVTENCNLQCEYCGYGKFYKKHDTRTNRSLSPLVARRLLQYQQSLWDSPINHSHDQNIYISFYGGEPLLNFPFIREMTAYVKTLKLRHNRFRFSITTNGLLVGKYMDFLVENDFNLLISLDGDERSNEYRVFKNGKPAYRDIWENIKALQAKYPAYFENKVNFNAVLHNKNSVSGVFHFFKQHLNKTPRIASLNTTNIAEAQKESFWETYANVNESLYESEDYSLIERDMFIKLPNIQSVSTFLHANNDFCFADYNEMLYPGDEQPGFPTGTCIPFSKKIFVTAGGNILPCERIAHDFGLGQANPREVEIDFETIAASYNAWHDKIRSQCYRCFQVGHCIQCIFNLEIQEKKPVCNGFMNRYDYGRYLVSHLDFIEAKPSIYAKILKDVVVQ